VVTNVEQIDLSGGAPVAATASLTIPPTCVFAELQADTTRVRYRCDQVDPAVGVGMILHLNQPPLAMLVEDLRNLRMIRDAGAGGCFVNITYYGTFQ
jgi:hypothetical protein